MIVDASYLTVFLIKHLFRSCPIYVTNRIDMVKRTIYYLWHFGRNQGF